MSAHDLVIAGGGAIGLTAAFEAASAGMSVAVVDPSPGRGAFWAAAGMLAPISEAHFGEESLVALLLAAATRWPDFAERLSDAAGMRVEVETSGTIQLGFDASDRHDVERMVAFQRSLGLVVDDLGREDLRRLEPNVAPAARYAVLVAGDHRVDNRAFASGLLAALLNQGVNLIAANVIGVSSTPQGVSMATTSGTVEGGTGLLALGASTNQIEGLEHLDIPSVRPVKGHILRLRGDEPLVHRTIRATVRGKSVYIVPRSSGEIVVGATVEERGFDTSVQAGEVYRLLDDARRIVPGIDELELVEASCGLRPATRSNAPVVRRIDGSNVIVATGHFRNGVLLAPITASYIVSMILERPDADDRFFDELAGLT